MKYLVFIVFILISHCIPDMTTDKAPNREDAKNNCILAYLLYTKDDGKPKEGRGLLALFACDSYLNWDPYDQK
jgi:hypothetical protein